MGRYEVTAGRHRTVPNVVAADDSRHAGDHPLESRAGRWDAVGHRWVIDEAASPCVDADDPAAPVGDEPVPNGGRVNVGVYAGTAEAGKSGFMDPP